jgi:hypothetical protein
VRRITARGCSVPDDSGTEEEQAGGGPGPAGGGSEQEDRVWIRADDVYSEYWQSTHRLDDGGDTVSPRASGHCMCDLHMHMYRYDRAEVVLTLFRSIGSQSYAVESQRIRGSVTSLVASSFELNQCLLLLHLCIQTWPLVHQATKTAVGYLASRSLA